MYCSIQKRKELFVGAQQSPDIQSPLNYFWTSIQDKRLFTLRVSKETAENQLESLALANNFTKMGVKVSFQRPVLVFVEKSETVTILDEHLNSTSFELKSAELLERQEEDNLLQASANAGTFDFLKNDDASAYSS